jgi:hypothetical protein
MPLSGARWPVRHGLGRSFSDFVQVRLPMRLVLMQGAGDCRSLLLSHLRLCLSQLGLGLFGPRLGPCGLRLRLVPGVLAPDPLPGLGASTSAPARPWTVRLLFSQAPSASDLTLVTRTTTRCCPEALVKLHPRSPAAIRKARTSGPGRQVPSSLVRSSAGDAQGQRRQAAVLDQRVGPRPTRTVLTVARRTLLVSVLPRLSRSRLPAMSRAAATRFALAVLRHTDSSSCNRLAGGRSRCPCVTVGDPSSGLVWHGRGMRRRVPPRQFSSPVLTTVSWAGSHRWPLVAVSPARRSRRSATR